MSAVNHLLYVGLVACLVAVGCAPGSSSTQNVGPGAERTTSAPKRVQAAVMSEPPNLKAALDATGIGRPGANVLEDLVSVGLSEVDKQGRRFPQLAETVPTIENGLWKLLPDGRMETTWRVRPEARWHDGTPVLSEDVLFTARLLQDRELPFVPVRAFQFIERIEAPDAQTVSIAWKQPFIDADKIFDDLYPKHLLERPYTDDKANFSSLTYWAEGFVGTGAFRLKEWGRGTHVLLEANPLWVFGRPKIDEITVTFIPDPNTLAANTLAGAVELTLGKSLSLEQAVQLGDAWRGGSIDVAPANPLVIYPQFIGTNPPVINNVEFRRALMHAIDRQQLADTFMYGRSSVPRSYLYPNQAPYQEIEARVPQYPYDPTRSAQMIEGLGYTKGPDGVFRDRGGERLGVELRTVTVDLNQKVILAVADHWGRVGVPTEPVVIPPQRVGDQEYVATFPGFLLYRNPPNFATLYGRDTRLPENNFRGSNNSRYINPAFDALLDRYFTTIGQQERIGVMGELIYHIADQVTVMGLFYDAQPTVIGSRLRNVSSAEVFSTQAWNAHDWEMVS